MLIAVTLTIATCNRAVVAVGVLARCALRLACAFAFPLAVGVAAVAAQVVPVVALLRGSEGGCNAHVVDTLM